jgi:GH25 family lysozyme M1 (1,4-beta-N-acetylmuramidase)
MNYGQQPNFYTSINLYDGTDYENPSKYELLISGYKGTEQKIENLDQAISVINYIKGLK